MGLLFVFINSFKNRICLVEIIKRVRFIFARVGKIRTRVKNDEESCLFLSKTDNSLNYSVLLDFLIQ